MINTKVIEKKYRGRVIQDIQRLELRFVLEGGQEIRTEMARRAPSDTGNLINSIQVEAGVRDGLAESETGPTAEYAPYVEYGTGIHAVNGDGRKTPWAYKDERTGKTIWTAGQEAQPFAEPGFQAAKQKLPAIAEKILGSI